MPLVDPPTVQQPRSRSRVAPRGDTTINTIAEVQGVLLILLATASLLVGGHALHGALRIELSENIIHLVAGGWLLFAAFTCSHRTVAISVGILSAMFLMMGISASSSGWVHEVVRLVVAGLGGVALLSTMLKRRRSVASKRKVVGV